MGDSAQQDSGTQVLDHHSTVSELTKSTLSGSRVLNEGTSFPFRGTSGILSHTEIDTAHFMGNFPESCELHAINSNELIPNNLDHEWTLVLPRTKLGPHRQHQFQLENVGQPFTHVKVIIYPDGGIKRVRIFGRKSGSTPKATTSTNGRISDGSEDLTLMQKSTRFLNMQNQPADESGDTSTSSSPSQQSPPPSATAIPAVALTPEAFASFGQVVQAYVDVNAVPSPRKTKITGANQGTALKFHKLAPVQSFYPSDAGATTDLSVYRCQPIELSSEGDWAVKLLERHPFTNQAFIPMGGVGLLSKTDGLNDPGTRYLIIVAENGEDNKPDLESLRAFVASASQGIVYNTGIWRESPSFSECHLFYSILISILIPLYWVVR